MTVLRDASPDVRLAAEDIFRDTLWGADRPVLQILDAATWNALENLASAGMISIHTRATRPLLPADGQRVLTPEQAARIAELRALAAKKLRAAETLVAAGLPEEAEPLRKAAEQAEAEAAAIAN